MVFKMKPFAGQTAAGLDCDMMQQKQNKLFRKLYIINLALIFVPPILYFIGGLIMYRGNIMDALVGGFVVCITLAHIFLAIFIGLNIWGIIKYPTHRLKFLIAIAISVIWIAWGIYELMTIQLP